MRRIPWFVILVTVVSIVVLYYGWQFEKSRYHFVAGPRAQAAPSALYARLTIRYDKPPVYQETYDMQDVEGISTFTYKIRGFNCRQITIKAPAAQVHDVSFFFGKLDQDGIWQLVNRTPLNDADAHYTVYVKQLADYKQGTRTVTFTDPQYWAKVGRQFSLDLSKQNSSDLLKMESQESGDPRYAQIVKDFREFGPDEFRNNVASAQQRVRSQPSACK